MVVETGLCDDLVGHPENRLSRDAAQIAGGETYSVLVVIWFNFVKLYVFGIIFSEQ